jgi:lycopene beta-cyclase
LQQANIVYIGIAGGQAKGSSGYAFQFIQKRTAAIVASLIGNRHPFVKHTITDKKFHLYDSVFLHVLHHKKINGDKIFADIFKANSPATVLKFLDNESSVWQDLKIMNSVDTKIFLQAAFAELFK